MNSQGAKNAKNELLIRRMFSRVAGRYDFLNSLLSFLRDSRWRAATAQMTLPRGAARVLDVCTGTGELGLAYARSSRDGSFVAGIDFSSRMLDLARCKCRASGLPLCLVRGDATTLPFKSGTFDVVAVAFGLRNVPDFRSALREMHRVLVPGGSVALLEFSFPRGGVLGRLYSLYLERVIPAIGRLVSGTQAYSYLARSVRDFSSRVDVLRHLGDAGFEEVSGLPLTFGVVTLYTGRKKLHGTARL